MVRRYVPDDDDVGDGDMETTRRDTGVQKRVSLGNICR